MLPRFLMRTLLLAQDWARVHGMSRYIAYAALIQAYLVQPSQRVAALARVLVTTHPNRMRRSFVAAAVAAARPRLEFDNRVDLVRSIVLKPAVSSRERGVLLVSFESELDKLARLTAFPELERDYEIVFLPTWQPFYSNALFHFAARARRPYCIMPSTPADRPLCSDLGSLCRSLPFQASSWVSRARSPQTRATKSIDFLMLANFSAYKRHWRLFEAMVDIPGDRRVVVAGRSLGRRTLGTLRREAAAFGVEGRVEFVENPSDEQVAQLLASAKVFCALSHKEGSYIAVAEALMSDTPVAMYSNALIGSKEYIGPETGALLDCRKRLAPQLLEFVERAETLRPAEWARAHICAELNCEKLNVLMRGANLTSGMEWTVDLSAFCCRHFEFEYAAPDAERRLTPEYAGLATRYGVTVRRPRATLADDAG